MSLVCIWREGCILPNTAILQTSIRQSSSHLHIARHTHQPAAGALCWCCVRDEPPFITPNTLGKPILRRFSAPLSSLSAGSPLHWLHSPLAPLSRCPVGHPAHPLPFLQGSALRQIHRRIASPNRTKCYCRWLLLSGTKWSTEISQVFVGCWKM